jgi:hypothetical protein
MSKENKMECNGKKYVTKKSLNGSCCSGCVFFVNGGASQCLSLRSENKKCMGGENKDGRSRIWVEDKGKNKPAAKTKGNDCYWIVEELMGDQKWVGVYLYATRAEARAPHEYWVRKTRVRKFVPAK